MEKEKFVCVRWQDEVEVHFVEAKNLKDLVKQFLIKVFSKEKTWEDLIKTIKEEGPSFKEEILEDLEFYTLVYTCDSYLVDREQFEEGIKEVREEIFLSTLGKYKERRY